jgi:CheY-like chemotaxis protein
MGTAVRQLPEKVVLTVDDEEQVCRVMARILADAGFHVLEAHSGAEAVTLLSTFAGRVQLVVSDVCMPGMSGADLARLVTKDWPTTPVLLVSGECGPLADYSGPFLPKPFRPEALVEAVAKLLPTENTEPRDDMNGPATNRNQVYDTLERAREAVLGSLMARSAAVLGREGWRAWRGLWAKLEATRLEQRMVTACMYCERLQSATGEWIAVPAGLAEMLRDPQVVQLSHGACPICLAGHLTGPETDQPISRAGSMRTQTSSSED